MTIPGWPWVWRSLYFVWPWLCNEQTLLFLLGAENAGLENAELEFDGLENDGQE